MMCDVGEDIQASTHLHSQLGFVSHFERGISIVLCQGSLQ